MASDTDILKAGKQTFKAEKPSSTHDSVKTYYGQVLKQQDDLKTSACCSSEEMPASHKAILGQITDEVLIKFYGCGSPLPPLLDGCTVLDLGCGSGRDVYLASKLVGPDGHVIGVDMTDNQLDVARRNLDEQMRRFGYATPNVEFRQGYIEQLSEAGIEDNSVDVVISNCVINLSPEKEQVFAEIFRVLKPGGELYFSDVFSDRRVPEAMRSDAVAYGECLGGAMYIEDFRRAMGRSGFADYRIVTSKEIAVGDARLRELASQVTFYSATIRAFKLDELEDRCEDYGQAAVYLGTIPEHGAVFDLDGDYRFEKGRAVLVCGNTAAILQSDRFAKHFTVIGDRSNHVGLFNDYSGPVIKPAETAMGGCC